MDWIVPALILCAVYTVGLLMGLYINVPHIGVLRIIHTSEEKDVYRFEFKEIDKLEEKKYAVMLIKTENDK